MSARAPTKKQIERYRRADDALAIRLERLGVLLQRTFDIADEVSEMGCELDIDTLAAQGRALQSVACFINQELADTESEHERICDGVAPSADRETQQSQEATHG